MYLHNRLTGKHASKPRTLGLLGQSVSGQWTNINKQWMVLREKGRDLTQSYGTDPYNKRKTQNAMWQHKTPHETSITQWLRNYIGRSVGIATHLVWLKQWMGSKFSHSPQQLCNRKHEHLGTKESWTYNFIICI